MALTCSLEFSESSLFTQFSTERRCLVVRLLERYLADGLIHSAGSFVTNMCNYTSEVQLAIGDEWIIKILIAFINLLSPHRFSSSANLLSILTPINAVLFQFLRQYIDRYYTGPNVQYSTLQRRSSIETLIHVNADASQLIAFGQPVPAFERLPMEERQRFASQTRYPLISSRVTLSPICSRADWMFAFCVAALNDPRVDEVSQRDFRMRLCATKQYTPIIMELLEQFQQISDNHIGEQW